APSAAPPLAGRSPEPAGPAAAGPPSGAGPAVASAPVPGAAPGLDTECLPGLAGLPGPRPAVPGASAPGFLTCPVRGSMRLRSRITGPALVSYGELIRRRHLLRRAC